MKTKRLLKNITFDHPGAHLAYTDGLGACSLMNDPILLKSLENGVVLTEAQKELLVKAGHDISEVSKSLTDETTNPSASTGEADNIDKAKEETMQNEKLEQLQKALVASKADNVQLKYGFDAELSKSIASIVVAVEDAEQEVLFKAFDQLMSKTVEQAPVANVLTKALEEEAGESGQAESVEKELTQADKISKYL